jgi:hypothetical protein
LRSTLADNYLVLHVAREYDSVLETVFKTELVTLLVDKIPGGGNLKFANQIPYLVKKSTWQAGRRGRLWGGGSDLLGHHSCKHGHGPMDDLE